MRYHPPIFGLSATLEINATDFPKLIQSNKIASEAKALFKQLHKDAQKASKEMNLPLFRFLYVFHQNGAIQKWID